MEIINNDEEGFLSVHMNSMQKECKDASGLLWSHK